MANPLLDGHGLRELLKDAVKRSGSKSNWANKNKFSRAFVCDLINGRREITDAVARKLGWKKVILYKEL